MAANGWLGRNYLKSLSMLINQGFFALFFGILINSRLRKLKIARVCKIRDVTSQITAELCTLARLNDNWSCQWPGQAPFIPELLV